MKTHENGSGDLQRLFNLVDLPSDEDGLIQELLTRIEEKAAD